MGYIDTDRRDVARTATTAPTSRSEELFDPRAPTPNEESKKRGKDRMLIFLLLLMMMPMTMM